MGDEYGGSGLCSLVTLQKCLSGVSFGLPQPKTPTSRQGQSYLLFVVDVNL